MYVLSALRIGACQFVDFVKALSNAQWSLCLVQKVPLSTKLGLVSRGKIEYGLQPVQVHVEIQTRSKACGPASRSHSSNVLLLQSLQSPAQGDGTHRTMRIQFLRMSLSTKFVSLDGVSITFLACALRYWHIIGC
jgi:hypothetical protein